MIEGTKLLDALPVAVYLTDAEGAITYYNAAAAEMWGRRPALFREKWCGSWRLAWPDGRPMPHEDCPLALTLKTGRAVNGVEAVMERPDGERVPFIPHPTLMYDDEGRVLGAINVLVDMAERHRAEIDQERLAAIVSSSEDAIVSKTLEGVITSWNQGAERIYGYSSEEMLGEPITKIVPPELHDEEEEILAKLRGGIRIDHFETERIAKDGRRIAVSLTVSPIKDRLGRVVGASKVARDVSERKRHEEMQKLLFDELNHRVKNMLAIIQAMASQSLRHNQKPSEFARAFSARVSSMARAHDLLVSQRMRGSELEHLLRQQLANEQFEDPRIFISGPIVQLSAKTTVHLALVLHELASNARKYGALAHPRGRLDISWGHLASAPNSLMIVWKESGLGSKDKPRDRGFGSTLIERSMDSSNGRAELVFSENALKWTLELPLEEGRDKSHIKDIQNEPMSSLVMTPEAAPRDNVHNELSGIRVLIIEDEPLVTLDIEMHLSSAGCAVVGPAPSVDRALRMIEVGEFDFALVDANLHGEQIGPVAEMLIARNIPFCFATGYGREGLPEPFRNHPVLTKPFSGEQMLEQISKVLSSRAS